MPYRGLCLGLHRGFIVLLIACTITAVYGTDNHNQTPELPPPPPPTSDLEPGTTTTTCDDQSYLRLWQQTAQKFTKQVKRYAEGLNFGAMRLRIQAAYTAQKNQGTETVGVNSYADSLPGETCTETCTVRQKKHLLDVIKSTKEMFTAWSSTHEEWSRAPVYVEGFPSLYALVHVAFRDRLDSMKRDVQKIEKQCKWKRGKSLAIIVEAKDSLESYQREVEEFYRLSFGKVKAELDRLDEYVLTNCSCNMYKEAS